MDLVSFTGGLATGRALMAAAAAHGEAGGLELGGKNPNVVFADADFETAVDFALTAVFLHSGQVCSAGARLIVEESPARRVRRRGRAPAPSGSGSAARSIPARRPGR